MGACGTNRASHPTHTILATTFPAPLRPRYLQFSRDPLTSSSSSLSDPRRTRWQELIILGPPAKTPRRRTRKEAAKSTAAASRGRSDDPGWRMPRSTKIWCVRSARSAHRTRSDATGRPSGLHPPSIQHLHASGASDYGSLLRTECDIVACADVCAHARHTKAVLRARE